MKPVETVRELFGFLQVDQRFKPDVSSRLNVSLVPEHATYHRLVSGQNALKTVGKAALPVAVRERIRSTI